MEEIDTSERVMIGKIWHRLKLKMYIEWDKLSAKLAIGKIDQEKARYLFSAKFGLDRLVYHCCYSASSLGTDRFVTHMNVPVSHNRFSHDLDRWNVHISVNKTRPLLTPSNLLDNYVLPLSSSDLSPDYHVNQGNLPRSQNKGARIGMVGFIVIFPFQPPHFSPLLHDVWFIESSLVGRSSHLARCSLALYFYS